MNKKILVEDLPFPDACKFGVAREQLAKDVGCTEDVQQYNQVRWMEEQLARIQGPVG